MTKNTDPKKLDQTNVGDAAVLVLDNGSSQSVTITDVYRHTVRLEWRTGPGPVDYLYQWLNRSQWLDRITLFPAGCKFLAV